MVIIIWTTIGFSVGVCFAAVTMTIAWFSDMKYNTKHLKEVREQAYNDGYRKGKEIKNYEKDAIYEELNELREKMVKLP